MKTLTMQLSEVELKFKRKQFVRDYTEGVTGWGFPVCVLQVEDLIQNIDLQLPECPVCRPEVYKTRLSEISNLWIQGIGIPKGFRVVGVKGLESEGLFVTEVFEIRTFSEDGFPSYYEFTTADFGKLWWSMTTVSRDCGCVLLAKHLFPGNQEAQDEVLMQWLQGNCIPKGWKLEAGYFVSSVDELPFGIWDDDNELKEFSEAIQDPDVYFVDFIGVNLGETEVEYPED